MKHCEDVLLRAAFCIIKRFGRLCSVLTVILFGGCGGGSSSDSIKIPVEADSSPKYLFAIEAGYFSYSSDLTYIAYKPSLHDSIVVLDTLSGVTSPLVKEPSATSYKFRRDNNQSLLFLSLVDDRSRSKLNLIDVVKGNETVIYDVQSHDVHDFCETPVQRIVLVGYDYSNNKNFVSISALNSEIPSSELRTLEISTVDDPLRIVCLFDTHSMVLS